MTDIPENHHHLLGGKESIGIWTGNTTSEQHPQKESWWPSSELTLLKVTWTLPKPTDTPCLRANHRKIQGTHLSETKLTSASQCQRKCEQIKRAYWTQRSTFWMARSYWSAYLRKPPQTASSASSSYFPTPQPSLPHTSCLPSKNWKEKQITALMQHTSWIETQF